MVYLPVPKNASTTYVGLLREQGWNDGEIENIDITDKILFGHIQDPQTRHTKGLAEFLFRSDIKKLDIDEKYHSILITSTPDVHTLPISVLYRNYYRKATWLPIDSNINSNMITSVFLIKNDINLKIPLDFVKHKSSKEFKLMVEKINQIKKDNADYERFVNFTLSEDIKLYMDSIDQLDIHLIKRNAL